MYNKHKQTDEELEADILKAIEENELVFFSYIVGFVDCSKSTLYERGMDKSNAIKKALKANRIKAKQDMIKKWGASDAPALQIARFKLMSNDKEHYKISGNKTDITSKGEKLDNVISINIVDTNPSSEEDGTRSD